jgi:hypothetical protein
MTLATKYFPLLSRPNNIGCKILWTAQLTQQDWPQNIMYHSADPTILGAKYYVPLS